MAMVLNEPGARSCRDVIGFGPPRIMSAVTLAEALVVADRRGLSKRMAEVLDLVDAEVLPATKETAAQVGDVYNRWGKRVHPARLNLIDCFAYAVARSKGCPLLYVGEDFAQTDIVSALPAERP